MAATFSLTTGIVYVRNWSGTLVGTELDVGAIAATNLLLTALATPNAPTVTPIGTSGSTTYGYKIVARNSLGVSVASAEGTTTTGNAALSATNYNRITWTAVSKAASYDVYRTTGGATQGKIGNVTGLTFDDTGLTGDGSVVPTVTTTGWATLQIVLASATSTNGTAPQYTFQGDTDTGYGYGGTDTLKLSTGGVTRMIITTSGFGYDSAMGGAVTQTTSKSTGVTLNKPTGEITMHNASLAGDTSVSFTLTNSTITATDMVLVQHVSGGTLGAYSATGAAAAGSATITVRNLTAGALAEAIVLKFLVIKVTN